MRVDMVGRFSACVLLAYRTPAAAVAPLVPRGLRLITKGEWAFWNVVACSIVRMRPAGIPEVLGISYDQTAYRLYVEAETRESGPVRGLYFVRSDAASRLVTISGNALTAFRFHAASVCVRQTGERITASVQGDGTSMELAVRTARNYEFPRGSCFQSADEARHFLKYVPTGLAPDRSGLKLRFAEVIRDESLWKEKPARVERADLQFFTNGAGAAGPANLEMATIIPPIPYRWRLGRTETTVKVA